MLAFENESAQKVSSHQQQQQSNNTTQANHASSNIDNSHHITKLQTS